MKKMFKRIGLILWVSTMVLTGCEAGNTVVKESEQQVQTGAETSEAPTPAAEPEVKEEPAEEVELTVSAAASLTEAMGEIQALYQTEKPNVTLVFNFGSSGSLQQQIEQGAPVDVFFSAAIKQMTALEEKGLVAEGTKKELLENKIVLITPKDKTDLMSFEDLVTDKAKQIGLGEPGSVPVGQYSEEIFTNLGILDQVKPKSVYGKDVKSVLTWVEQGEVDAGIVYATDANVSDKVNIICSAPEGSHKPVIYPVAAIKDSAHLEDTKAFIEFLSSDKVKQTFEKYGFAVKE
ncbi:MAG: molybdate transporter substrate-binding protein [Clostridia bacterium]|nr:molybdate transporter substrate-binding protein [Clostridia bacterium]